VHRALLTPLNFDTYTVACAAGVVVEEGEYDFHRSLAELFRPGDTAAETVLGVAA
jgi:hypothetical protein